MPAGRPSANSGAVPTDSATTSARLPGAHRATSCQTRWSITPITSRPLPGTARGTRCSGMSRLPAISEQSRL